MSFHLRYRTGEHYQKAVSQIKNKPQRKNNKNELRTLRKIAKQKERQESVFRPLRKNELTGREKSALITLRFKHGYSVNLLAKAFRRSSKSVWSVLRLQSKNLNRRWLDLRKLAGGVKARLRTQKAWIQLMKHWAGWQAWIESDEGKPP